MPVSRDMACVAARWSAPLRYAPTRRSLLQHAATALEAGANARAEAGVHLTLGSAPPTPEPTPEFTQLFPEPTPKAALESIAPAAIA